MLTLVSNRAAVYRFHIYSLDAAKFMLAFYNACWNFFLHTAAKQNKYFKNAPALHCLAGSVLLFVMVVSGKMLKCLLVSGKILTHTVGLVLLNSLFTSLFLPGLSTRWTNDRWAWDVGGYRRRGHGGLGEGEPIIPLLILAV